MSAINKAAIFAVVGFCIATFFPTHFLFALGKAADAQCLQESATWVYRANKPPAQTFVDTDGKPKFNLYGTRCQDSFVKAFCSKADFCDGKMPGSTCFSDGKWGPCKTTDVPVDQSQNQTQAGGTQTPVPQTQTALPAPPRSLFESALLGTTPTEGFDKAPSADNFAKSLQSLIETQNFGIGEPSALESATKPWSWFDSVKSFVGLSPQPVSQLSFPGQETPEAPFTAPDTFGQPQSQSSGEEFDKTGSAAVQNAETFGLPTRPFMDPSMETRLENLADKRDALEIASEKLAEKAQNLDDAGQNVAIHRSVIDGAQAKLDKMVADGEATVKGDKYTPTSQSSVAPLNKAIAEYNAAAKAGKPIFADYDDRAVPEYKSAIDVRNNALAELKTAIEAVNNAPAVVKAYGGLDPQTGVGFGSESAKIAAQEQLFYKEDQYNDLKSQIDNNYSPYNPMKFFALRDLENGLGKEVANLKQTISWHEAFQSCLSTCTNNQSLAEAYISQPTTPEGIAARNLALGEVQAWAQAQDRYDGALLAERTLGPSQTNDAEIRNADQQISLIEGRMGEYLGDLSRSEKVQAAIATIVSDNEPVTLGKILTDNSYNLRRISDGLRFFAEGVGDKTGLPNIINPAAFAAGVYDSAISLSGNGTLADQIAESRMSGLELGFKKGLDVMNVAIAADVALGGPLASSLQSFRNLAASEFRASVAGGDLSLASFEQSKIALSTEARPYVSLGGNVFETPKFEVVRVGENQFSIRGPYAEPEGAAGATPVVETSPAAEPPRVSETLPTAPELPTGSFLGDSRIANSNIAKSVATFLAGFSPEAAGSFDTLTTALRNSPAAITRTVTADLLNPGASLLNVSRISEPVSGVVAPTIPSPAVGVFKFFDSGIGSWVGSALISPSLANPAPAFPTGIDLAVSVPSNVPFVALDSVIENEPVPAVLSPQNPQIVTPATPAPPATVETQQFPGPTLGLPPESNRLAQRAPGFLNGFVSPILYFTTPFESFFRSFAGAPTPAPIVQTVAPLSTNEYVEIVAYNKALANLVSKYAVKPTPANLSRALPSGYTQSLTDAKDLLERAGLTVRPEDQSIARKENGEVVATQVPAGEAQEGYYKLIAAIGEDPSVLSTRPTNVVPETPGEGTIITRVPAPQAPAPTEAVTITQTAPGRFEVSRAPVEPSIVESKTPVVPVQRAHPVSIADIWAWIQRAIGRQSLTDIAPILPSAESAQTSPQLVEQTPVPPAISNTTGKLESTPNSTLGTLRPAPTSLGYVKYSSNDFEIRDKRDAKGDFGTELQLLFHGIDLAVLFKVSDLQVVETEEESQMTTNPETGRTQLRLNFNNKNGYRTFPLFLVTLHEIAHVVNGDSSDLAKQKRQDLKNAVEATKTTIINGNKTEDAIRASFDAYYSAYAYKEGEERAAWIRTFDELLTLFQKTSADPRESLENGSLVSDALASYKTYRSASAPGYFLGWLRSIRKSSSNPNGLDIADDDINKLKKDFLARADTLFVDGEAQITARANQVIAQLPAKTRLETLPESSVLVDAATPASVDAELRADTIAEASVPAKVAESEPVSQLANLPRVLALLPTLLWNPVASLPAITAGSLVVQSAFTSPANAGVAPGKTFVAPNGKVMPRYTVEQAQALVGKSQEVTLSWFRDRTGAFNGNGIDQTKIGFAHPNLPPGTVLRVTVDGKTVEGPVIDLGPGSKKADLDITQAGCKALNFCTRGLVPAEYTVVSVPTSGQIAAYLKGPLKGSPIPQGGRVVPAGEGVPISPALAQNSPIPADQAAPVPDLAKKTITAYSLRPKQEPPAAGVSYAKPPAGVDDVLNTRTGVTFDKDGWLPEGELVPGVRIVREEWAGRPHKGRLRDDNSIFVFHETQVIGSKGEPIDDARRIIDSWKSATGGRRGVYTPLMVSKTQIDREGKPYVEVIQIAPIQEYSAHASRLGNQNGSGVEVAMQQGDIPEPMQVKAAAAIADAVKGWKPDIRFVNHQDPEGLAMKNVIAAREARLPAPSPGDATKFAEILKQKGTAVASAASLREGQSVVPVPKPAPLSKVAEVKAPASAAERPVPITVADNGETLPIEPAKLVEGETPQTSQKPDTGAPDLDAVARKANELNKARVAALQGKIRAAKNTLDTIQAGQEALSAEIASPLTPAKQENVEAMHRALAATKNLPNIFADISANPLFPQLKVESPASLNKEINAQANTLAALEKMSGLDKLNAAKGAEKKGVELIKKVGAFITRTDQAIQKADREIAALQKKTADTQKEAKLVVTPNVSFGVVPGISAGEKALSLSRFSYTWDPFANPTAGAPAFISTEPLPASPTFPVEVATLPDITPQPLALFTPPAIAPAPYSRQEVKDLIAKFKLTKVNPKIAESVLPPRPVPYPEALPPQTDPLFKKPIGALTDSERISIIRTSERAIQDYWEKVFRESGGEYRRADIVIIDSSSKTNLEEGEESGHGFVGANGNVYVDLNDIRFISYEKLSDATGLVIAQGVAHEIAHYIARITAMDLKALKAEFRYRKSPPLSAVTGYSRDALEELQADYLAGVSLKASGLLGAGDPEKLYYYVASTGDDVNRIFLKGSPTAGAYTHGTGADRAQVFYDGLTTGNLDKGLTILGTTPDWKLANASIPWNEIKIIIRSAAYDNANISITRVVSAPLPDIAPEEPGPLAAVPRIPVEGSSLPDITPTPPAQAFLSPTPTPYPFAPLIPVAIRPRRPSIARGSEGATAPAEGGEAPATPESSSENPPARSASSQAPMEPENIPAPPLALPAPPPPRTPMPNVNKAAPPDVIALPGPAPEPQSLPPDAPQWYVDWSAFTQNAEQSPLFAQRFETPDATTPVPTPVINPVPVIPANAPAAETGVSAQEPWYQKVFSFFKGEPSQVAKSAPVPAPVLEPSAPPTETVVNPPAPPRLPTINPNRAETPGVIALGGPTEPVAQNPIPAPTATPIPAPAAATPNPTPAPTPGGTVPGEPWYQQFLDYGGGGSGRGGGSGGSGDGGGSQPPGGPTPPKGDGSSGGSLSARALKLFCGGPIRALVCAGVGIGGIAAILPSDSNQGSPPPRTQNTGGAQPPSGLPQTGPKIEPVVISVPGAETPPTNPPTKTGPSTGPGTQGPMSPNGTSPSGGGGLGGAMSALGQIFGQLLSNLFNKQPQQSPPTVPPAPTQPPTLPTPNAPVPIVTLTASPTTVASGTRAILTWSSLGVNACDILSADGIRVGQGVRGSTSTPALATTTPFVAKCTTPSTSVFATTTVNVQ